MADTKQDVLDMLRDLAELTMLEEGDPQSFRVRAYESAAQAIAAQATDLGKLTRMVEGEVLRVGDKLDLVVRADRGCAAGHLNRLAEALAGIGVRSWKLATSAEGG